MKEMLFNGELLEKAKGKVVKFKDWVVENPELAMIGGAFSAYAILVTDALVTGRNGRRCERTRTKAYVQYFDRQQ